MTAALVSLNPAALVTLADCEQRIERGLKSFVDVGEALATIRDSRLYRRTHATFEDYCRERWGFSDRRASQFIEAASVVPKILGTGLPVPVVESQARALAAVPEPERAEVWREAVERTEGRPTAKVVREVAEERTAPTQTPGPAAAPTVPVAGPGSASPEPGRPDLRLVNDPEQAEAERMETQRVQIVERARKRAPRLVHEIRDLINEVVAGINLGEIDLVTPQAVADIRALVDILEARMEATQ